MLPDGSQYAVQFNGRLNNFSLNSYTFMAGWCAQKISGFARWQAVDSSAAPPSTAVPISDNFKGPRTFNIWSSTGWAVGLAGQGFSISTTSGKRGISGSLLIDIPYLKWHLWLQSTWMEYERFQEIGDHEKQGDGRLQVENGGYQFYTASKWENRALLVQGFETLCISSMFWPFDGSQLLTQTCPLSMAMSQSKHRIKSNEPKLHNAYSCSGVYCTHYITIIYVVRTCFSSIVVIFIHIRNSKWLDLVAVLA